MNLEEFIRDYPVRLATDKDLDTYLQFVKDRSMAAGFLKINLLRTQSLLGSFQEQGLQAYPFFLVNTNGSILGFFSVAVRRSLMNGRAVEYGYLSDLKLDTQHPARALANFRRTYREFLRHYKSLEEFKNAEFFLTAILHENKNAQKALTRQRSGIVYQPAGSYQVECVLIHPGYLLPTKTSLQIQISEVSAEALVPRTGLSDPHELLQRSAAFQITITKAGEKIFSALFAKPSLRKLELQFGTFPALRVSQSPTWLLQMQYTGPGKASLALCLRLVVRELLRQKHVGVGTLMMFENRYQPSGLFPAKMIPGSYYKVSSVPEADASSLADFQSGSGLVEEKIDIRLEPFLL